MKTLIIDSSDNKEIVVGLSIDGNKDLLKHTTDSKKAQIILPLIEKILKKHSLKLEDLNSIDVNPGPGSFTGLRVGISIANTLGTMLKIPINGNSVGELVEPIYR